MKTVYFLSVLAGLIISAGCKKVDTPTDDSKALIGSWQYLTSNATIYSADTAVFSKQNWITFTENGRYRFYDGSNCKDRARFSFKLYNFYGEPEKLMIFYKDRYDPQSFEIHNNVLYLTDETKNGYTHLYVRM